MSPQERGWELLEYTRGSYDKETSTRLDVYVYWHPELGPAMVLKTWNEP